MTYLCWHCPHCNCKIISNRLEHHKIDYCDCKKSGVDAEVEYVRIIGDAVLENEI